MRWWKLPPVSSDETDARLESMIHDWSTGAGEDEMPPIEITMSEYDAGELPETLRVMTHTLRIVEGCVQWYPLTPGLLAKVRVLEEQVKIMQQHLGQQPATEGERDTVALMQRITEVMEWVREAFPRVVDRLDFQELQDELSALQPRSRFWEHQQRRRS